MVQKMWSQFLSKRMDKEMEKYHNIEVAFSKIKACTGNSDVREMVTKFMTKEQTYSTLL
jgi:arginyl-tRNA synthetase